MYQRKHELRMHNTLRYYHKYIFYYAPKISPNSNQSSAQNYSGVFFKLLKLEAS